MARLWLALMLAVAVVVVLGLMFCRVRLRLVLQQTGVRGELVVGVWVWQYDLVLGRWTWERPEDLCRVAGLIFELLRRKSSSIGSMGIRYKRYIEVTKFRWITAVGQQDAALAGWLLAFVYSVKSIMTVWVCHLFPVMCPPRVVVIPCFGGTIFRTRIDCIFRLRLVHLIHGLFKYVLRGQNWRISSSQGTGKRSVSQRRERAEGGKWSDQAPY